MKLPDYLRDFALSIAERGNTQIPNDVPTPILVPLMPHRKKRINKKWLKRYGVKVVPALDEMHDDYHYLILQNPDMLFLCGYIGIPKSHKLFGKDYITDDEVDSIQCHGGVTYSGNSLPQAKKNLWYIGFDCGHAGDLIPSFSKFGFGLYGGTYKNIEYVKNEIQSMHEQLRVGVTDGN